MKSLPRKSRGVARKKRSVNNSSRGITTVCNERRNIALATYDGEGAADAIIRLAEAIHRSNTPAFDQTLNTAADALYEYGRDRGSNVHLLALIRLRRKLLDAVTSSEDRGKAHNDLGLRFKGSASGRTGRRGSKRRPQPFARRWRNSNRRPRPTGMKSRKRISTRSAPCWPNAGRQ